MAGETTLVIHSNQLVAAAAEEEKGEVEREREREAEFPHTKRVKYLPLD